MSKTIVNLTMPFIVEKIEQILDNHPYHPYQQAFANPDTRQTLIAYVLSRVPSSYIAVDEGEQQHCMDSVPLHYSLRDALHLERIICEGIMQIMTDASEEVSHHIPEEVDPGLSPSHWFG